LMMERVRCPSRILTVLPDFSALVPDLSIVFGSYDREAAVPSGRPRAGQKLVREAGAPDRRDGLSRIPVGALDP